MSRGSFSKLALEIRDHIWSGVLQGGKHLIADPKAYLRCPAEAFRYVGSNYCPPAYAGILVASKAISQEVQETLYKKCVFRAYLCNHIDRLMDASRSEVFSRLQKVELSLDVNLYPSLLSGMRMIIDHGTTDNGSRYSATLESDGISAASGYQTLIPCRDPQTLLAIRSHFGISCLPV